MYSCKLGGKVTSLLTTPTPRKTRASKKGHTVLALYEYTTYVQFVQVHCVFLLSGLQPNQHYEASIKARNDIGWSDPSQQFIFLTADGKFAAFGDVATSAIQTRARPHRPR